MHRRSGFIVQELLWYLILGTFLLGLGLKLFLLSLQSFELFSQRQDDLFDFLNVSERIKYDLMTQIDALEVAPQSLRFSFWRCQKSKLGGQKLTYCLCHRGTRLVYEVNTCGNQTHIYLSSKVEGIRCERQQGVLILYFDYRTRTFWRAYRIDHILSSRILHRGLPSFDALFNPFGSLHFAGGQHPSCGFKRRRLRCGIFALPLL